MKPDIKCSSCGGMIHWLEVFPDDFCLACHAERENKKPIPTAEEIMTIFKKSVRI